MKSTRSTTSPMPLTKDPIGYDAGSHLYVYADNDPVLNSDSYGLWVMRCSRGLGNKYKPAASKYRPNRHDYLNVSGKFIGFQAGENTIPYTNFLWSQGHVQRGDEFDGGRCHTMICSDNRFDKYVVKAANYEPMYCIVAYPGTSAHLMGARNCQTWANTVISRAKIDYLKNEKCPSCFK